MNEKQFEEFCKNTGKLAKAIKKYGPLKYKREYLCKDGEPHDFQKPPRRPHDPTKDYVIVSDECIKCGVPEIRTIELNNEK